MKALFLVFLLIGVPAVAQGVATDAPLVTSPISKGDPAPADGVFMTTDSAIALDNECKERKMENTALKSAVENPSPTWTPNTATLIVGAVVALAGGFALGLAVSRK